LRYLIIYQLARKLLLPAPEARLKQNSTGFLSIHKPLLIWQRGDNSQKRAEHNKFTRLTYDLEKKFTHASKNG